MRNCQPIMIMMSREGSWLAKAAQSVEWGIAQSKFKRRRPDQANFSWRFRSRLQSDASNSITFIPDSQWQSRLDAAALGLAQSSRKLHLKKERYASQALTWLDFSSIFGVSSNFDAIMSKQLSSDQMYGSKKPCPLKIRAKDLRS